MNWTFDPKNQLFYPRVNFKAITSGLAGETIDIPDIPPSDGFSVPQTQIPTIPQITFPASWGNYFSSTGTSGSPTGTTPNADYAFGAWEHGGGWKSYDSRNVTVVTRSVAGTSAQFKVNVGQSGLFLVAGEVSGIVTIGGGSGVDTIIIEKNGTSVYSDYGVADNNETTFYGYGASVTGLLILAANDEVKIENNATAGVVDLLTFSGVVLRISG
jgi:hypothetical protein